MPAGIGPAAFVRLGFPCWPSDMQDSADIAAAALIGARRRVFSPLGHSLRSQRKMTSGINAKKERKNKTCPTGA